MTYRGSSKNRGARPAETSGVVESNRARDERVHWRRNFLMKPFGLRVNERGKIENANARLYLTQNVPVSIRRICTCRNVERHQSNILPGCRDLSR